MTLPRVKSGVLPGELPFARVEGGPQTLVVFPGLIDALWDVRAQAWTLPYRYRNFLSDFTVWLVSRKRRLPAGHSTRDMAADYAAAIQNDIGPARVLGLSMGGCIAAHLAADFPQLVQRLVIACAAHRPDEHGRRIPERWLALAREQRWREFYLDLARVTLKEYQHNFYEFLGPLLRVRDADPGNFLISLQACVAHDATDRLPAIRAPTLVIGGAHDPFFPEPILREAAALIPNATLHLLNGAGHGAPRLHKDEFERAILEFFR
jgi:pimeloyl-ACP methyl ester carboxylesterase